MYHFVAAHIEIQTVFMETNKQDTLSLTTFVYVIKIMCILKPA
jgi:hypothetical protein